MSILFKKGELFGFSYGAYSDKGWVGPFRALVDVTVDMMNDVREAVTPEDDSNPSMWKIRDRFVAELARRQWCEDVPYLELDLGDSYDEMPEFRPWESR